MSREIKTDPEYVRFLTAIIAGRKRKGLTQDQLGRILGKDQSFVSKVEHGERRLDVIEAIRWCGSIDMKLEDAVGAKLLVYLRK